MRKTLLQKAKEVEINSNRIREVTKEELEIVLAWLNNEITWKQIATILPWLDDKSMNYGRITTILLRAIRKGWIKIKVI